jgi:hypothetical protein
MDLRVESLRHDLFSSDPWQELPAIGEWRVSITARQWSGEQKRPQDAAAGAQGL